MPARTPKQCDDLFAKHIEAGNVDAVVALYEPKACLLLEGGAAARGTSAIRKAITMFAAMKPAPTVRLVEFDSGTHFYAAPEPGLPVGLAPAVVKLWYDAIMQGYYMRDGKGGTQAAAR